MKILKLLQPMIFVYFILGISLFADQITILHINDHHSHLRADKRMGIKIDGKSTRTIPGGFPAVVSMVKNLSNGKDNIIKLHAGDAITGDLYYTLFKGEANAKL